MVPLGSTIQTYFSLAPGGGHCLLLALVSSGNMWRTLYVQFILRQNGDNMLSVAELSRGIRAIDPSCSVSDAMDIARTTDDSHSGDP